MNYKLRTFRGNARMANLCLNSKKANLIRLLFLPIFLVLFSFNAYSQGSSLSFDGVDDYVSTTNPDFYSGGDFTIEGWFKSTDNEAGLVSLRGSNGEPGIFVGLGLTGTLQFLYRNPTGGAGGQSLVSTSTTLADGNWHHYACVKDGSQMLLYIDGSLDGSTAVGADFTANQLVDVELGRNGASGSTRYFDGQMDNIRFWNKALTGTEIGANYNIVFTSPSSISNLIVNYTFDGVTGTTIPDVSGNSNTGTINRGANTTGGSIVVANNPTSSGAVTVPGASNTSSVVYDNNQQSFGQSGASSISLSNFSVPAGDDRILVVTLANGHSVFGTVQFDGNTMTHRRTEVLQGGRIAIYTYNLGSSTTATVGDITVTGGIFLTSIGAQSFHNVDQTAPIDNIVSSSNSNVAANSSSLSITSEANDMAVDFIAVKGIGGVNGPFTLTPGINQTATFNNNTGIHANTEYLAIASSHNGGAASVTMDWGISPTIQYGHIGVNLNAAVVATPTSVGFNATAICGDATEWLVPINVGTFSADLGAVSLVLDYDNTKLTYQSISSSHTNLDAANNPIQIIDNNGKISISWASASGATISDETLMTLRFVPANSAADFSAIAGQTTDFSWDESVSGNCEFADNMGNLLSATFNAQTGAAVNALPTPTFSNDATSNTICAGDNVTFTAGGGMNYEFFVNNVSQVAASTTTTFSSTTLADNDVVKVTVTNANGCSASSEVTMTVNPLPTPGLTSDATSNTLCAGDNVTFTGTGGTSYEFFVDNVSQGAASATATFSTTTLTNGQVVTVTATDANGCSAISTGLTMVVNPLPTAGLTSDDADNTICAGDNVTFTATGGTSYEFFVDNVSQGAASATATFSTTSLTDGQTVTVTATDGNGCSATSAGIATTVNAAPTAGLTSDATANTICAGETITFTAMGGNTYEFFVNNVSQGTASSTATFSSSSLVNGDKVKVSVTNANGCVAESAEITVTVNPLPTTALASDDADSKICPGTSVTFTASSSDGADEFIFVSSIDGTVQAQSATATYTDAGLQNGEVISVIGVNSSTGCQQVSTTTFTMDVAGCYDISGNLVYKNSAETPMGNVVITVKDGSNVTVGTVTTDVADGGFTVSDLYDNDTYTFSYATTKSHGGINSTDALFVLLDVVGLNTLTGLNETTADVNDDNVVAAGDALQIQQRFVGAINSFAAGDWVFDAGSFTINGASTTGNKLYALATGDINGSYTPNAAENGTPTVSMINDGQLVVNDGDRVQIPVRIKNGADVGAMSLSMFFPSNAMTIHDITLANGNTLLHNVNGNEARMAWANMNSTIFANDDVLYYIDATINDVAAYNNAPFGINIESELANGNGQVIDAVTLGVPTITGTVTSTSAIEAAAASVRSFPNPFTTQMTIEYDLSSTSNVQIQLFNSLGQELTILVSETQSEGTHRAIWNAENRAAGVYYYTITVTEGSNSYKFTKQVVLVK